jgi:hypothetical protein
MSVHFKRLASLLFCAVIIVAACTFAVDASGAVVPPPGTPDLSQMTVLPADLPAGASVKSQGYIHEQGDVAAYDREFGATRIGGARVANLDSSIEVLESADDASTAFMSLGELLRHKSFRTQLGRGLAASARANGKVKIRKVIVAAPVAFKIGDGALIVSITLSTSVGQIHGLLAFSVLDRTESTLVTLSAPGAHPTAGGLARLMTATAGRIHAGLLPVASALPAVGGLAQQNQMLTATPGTWTNTPTAFAYQWQRCDTGGNNCVAVAGAAGQSYLLSPADAGSTLRVAVTATNGLGSVTATSAPTAVVV